MKILFIFILHFINMVACLEESKSTIFFINANDALLAKSEKPVLRYGFHRTEECKKFDKAYLCIQKCIDLNYDVAHADKNCRCTCYIKQERAKYKPVSPATKTRWRSGAPKTSIPYWANPNKVNKTRDEGSGSAEAVTKDDATNNQGDITGRTEKEGGAGTGVTAAANTGGAAGAGGGNSTNTGQGTGATVAAGATGGVTGGGATGGPVTGGGITTAAPAA